MATNPENAYRNGTMYSSYTAASFARKYLLADYHNVNFLGAVSWSFEFEDQPWFYGFRDLATNGVDKPVLNVFRMFGMMQGKRIEVSGNKMYSLTSIRDSSVRRGDDVGGLAAKDKNNCTVMLWNYHDDDTTGLPEKVAIKMKDIPAKNVTITEYRIDSKHSNSYEVWKGMGSPKQPTTQQIATLEKVGKLQTIGDPIKLLVKNGVLVHNISMPRQAVSLLKIEW